MRRRHPSRAGSTSVGPRRARGDAAPTRRVARGASGSGPPWRRAMRGRVLRKREKARFPELRPMPAGREAWPRHGRRPIARPPGRRPRPSRPVARWVWPAGRRSRGQARTRPGRGDSLPRPASPTRRRRRPTPRGKGRAHSRSADVARDRQATRGRWRGPRRTGWRGRLRAASFPDRVRTFAPLATRGTPSRCRRRARGSDVRGGPPSKRTRPPGLDKAWGGRVGWATPGGAAAIRAGCSPAEGRGRRRG